MLGQRRPWGPEDTGQWARVARRGYRAGADASPPVLHDDMGGGSRLSVLLESRPGEGSLLEVNCGNPGSWTHVLMSLLRLLELDMPTASTSRCLGHKNQGQAELGLGAGWVRGWWHQKSHLQDPAAVPELPQGGSTVVLAPPAGPGAQEAESGVSGVQGGGLRPLRLGRPLRSAGPPGPWMRARTALYSLHPSGRHCPLPALSALS